MGEIKNKKRKIMSFALALTLLIGIMAGCGKAATDSMYGGITNSDQQEMYDSKYEYSVEMEGDMALGNMVDKPSENTGSSGANNNPQTNSSRKLITTVNMETETEHYDDLMLWLNARIGEYNGYVEYSENYGNQNSRRSASLTIRIPAENLDVFLTGISEESNVTYQSRSVKDITLNYVDVESHKAALLVEQERLMELLQKADNLQDLLRIEERLTDVRYELESYESQLRTYDNQINYSTIRLSVREVRVLTTPEPEGFFARVSAGFKENLKEVTDGIVEFAIGFLSNIPTITIWAIVLIFLGLVLKKTHKVRAKRRNDKNLVKTEVSETKQNTVKE